MRERARERLSANFSLSLLFQVLYDNRLVKFCRSYLCITQGTWLIHGGFVMQVRKRERNWRREARDSDGMMNWHFESQILTLCGLINRHFESQILTLCSPTAGNINGVVASWWWRRRSVNGKRLTLLQTANLYRKFPLMQCDKFRSRKVEALPNYSYGGPT